MRRAVSARGRTQPNDVYVGEALLVKMVPKRYRIMLPPAERTIQDAAFDESPRRFAEIGSQVFGTISLSNGLNAGGMCVPV